MVRDLRQRALLQLGASFALMWVISSMLAGPGAAVLVRLTGRSAFGGAFIAAFFLGVAAGGVTAGRLMDRVGRLPVLRGAALVAAGGAAGAAWLQSEGPWPWLLGVTALLGAGMGAANLTRVAAAEMFPPAARGRAMGSVQVMATVGAVVGPLLLVLVGPSAMGLDAVWWVAVPLAVAAWAALLAAPEPSLLAPAGPSPVAAAVTLPDVASKPPAPAVPPAQGPGLAFPGLVLVVAQAAMVAVMGVAGAAVVAAGGSPAQLGTLMLLHFVGMFGLSRVVGSLADRIGRMAVVRAGLASTVAAGVVLAGLPGFRGVGIGLLLSGMGWSLAYIGGSLMLADGLPPALRARTTGRVDLFAALAAAMASGSAGVAFGQWGLPGLGAAAAVLASLPLLGSLTRRAAVVPRAAA